MRRILSSGLLALLASSPIAAQPQATLGNDPAAVEIIDRAIARLGGETTLRSVKSLRLDVMTQWLRTSFVESPVADRPSYERNVELRDYATNAWRNTRTFLGGAGEVVDIVRDTVGGRRFNGPNGQVMEMPLNIAYVDERRELFGFAPERVLLLARDGGAMRVLSDTTVAGVRHARVTTTICGFPTTILISRADDLPAMVRFRANEDNDFGLAPWGTMDVEVWYSNWAMLPPGVMLPRQRDVWRVGRPYKRMTAISTLVNAPAPADSFAIADSVVASYLGTQRKPMWDTWVDAAVKVDGDFVTLPPMTGTFGAVRVGGKWVLIEAAQSRGAAERVARWLATSAPNMAEIGAAIVTHGSPGSGGAAWFAERRLPLYIAPAARPNIRAILGRSLDRATTVSTSRWVKVGTDSLWLEPLDIPNETGVLAVYSPTLKWVASPIVLGRGPITKADQDALIARLRARGLAVEWIGTARGVKLPAP